MTERSSGLVLGRFQPLHPGHLGLKEQALHENDELVVCIGSAQRAEPFTIEQRHQNLDSQLRVLHPNSNWRVVDLVDPQPMESWPEVVASECGLSGNNRFYRAENDSMTDDGEQRLRNLGFSLIYVSRKPFYHMFPDGLYRSVSSSSEIKAIHHELGLDISKYPRMLPKD